jgi:hypothetical protein
VSTDRESTDTACAGAGFPSARSILIGCALCAVIGVAGPYWTIYLQSSRMFEDYHTAGATFFLFVLFVVFNLGLARLWRAFALREHELMAIGAMMLVGGSIATSGLIAYFIPAITSAYYFANSSNQWATELWQHLPKALSPLDPNGGTFAIRKFWTGLPGDEPIPWGPWVGPLLIWAIFLAAMFACTMAVMAIMRKQWVDHEHLSFPIAQVPAELCSAAVAPTAAVAPAAGASILRSTGFWIGLGLTFLMASSGGLGHYFGVFPFFRVRYWLELSDPPWRLPLYVDLVVMGLAFLIPNRVAFSVWFVALLAWFLRTFMQAYNLQLPDDWVYGDETHHLALGATIVFVVGSLWLARGHLGRALRCAFGAGERAYDRGEPCSYRAAFLMILVSLIVMVAWLRQIGLHYVYGVLLVLLTLAVYYAMARVVAQCGLPMLSPPIYPTHFLVSAFGTSNLGSQQVGVCGMYFGWHFDMRNSPMSGAGHGMFLTRRRRGGLLWPMLLALLITYVTAALCTVWVSYRHGAVNMDPWFFGTYPPLPWVWAQQAINLHSGPSYARLAWAGGGATLMAVLLLAQRAWFWWPLHPVGLLVCSSHMVYFFWVSVFLAWLVKALLVAFGGPGVFAPARRFFIGMVMGYFLAGGVWAIVDTIAHSPGNSVFYI